MMNDAAPEESVSAVTVLDVPAIAEVTAAPTSSEPERLLSITLDPVIGVQVVPSLEGYAAAGPRGPRPGGCRSPDRS